MATINRESLGHKHKKGSSKPSYNMYQKYYSNPLWRSNRDYYLGLHPLCEICMQHNRITPAEEVHHMIPWNRGIDEKHKLMLLINPDNFCSICKTCHTALHKLDSKQHRDVLNYLSPEEYEDAHQLKWMK